MHDIGRFVMFDQNDAELGIYGSGWTSFNELLKAEIAICGCSHAELGSEALKIWGLPIELSLLVLRHHDYQENALGELTLQQQNIVRVVQLADSVSVLLTNREYRDAGRKARTTIMIDYLDVIGFRKLPLSAAFSVIATEKVQEEANGIMQSIGIR